MRIIGLDPGTERSAVCVFEGGSRRDCVLLAVTEENEQIRQILLGKCGVLAHEKAETTLAIEEFESFGMAVGREVFRTVFWAGRFAEAWGMDRVVQIPRRIVKAHLCHTTRATDANVRQEILDRFGGKAAAVGLKKSPGPLYGVKGHEFAALAVALTHYDQERARLGFASR